MNIWRVSLEISMWYLPLPPDHGYKLLFSTSLLDMFSSAASAKGPTLQDSRESEVKSHSGDEGI